MMTTTLESLPGRPIAVHPHNRLSGAIGAGELKGYSELLQESRQEAFERMLEEARGLGANAVLNVRFSTSSVAQGASEILAYGSAVQVTEG